MSSAVGLFIAGAALAIAAIAGFGVVSITPSWVEATATVALALFGVLQIVIERRRAAQRAADDLRRDREATAVRDLERQLARDAAEHRASYVSYCLRRSVMSWYLPNDQQFVGVLRWARAIGPGLGEHFDRAERYADELSRLAPHMVGRKRAAAVRAGVLFLHATNRVNQYVNDRASIEASIETVGAPTSLAALASLLGDDLVSDEMTAEDIAIEANRAEVRDRVFGAMTSGLPVRQSGNDGGPAI